MFKFIRTLFSKRSKRKRQETVRLVQLEAKLHAAAQEQTLACQSSEASTSNLHRAIQENAAQREETVKCLSSFLEQEEAFDLPPVRPASGLRKSQPLKTLGTQGQSA
jgi:hypothetical protein